MGQGHEQPHGVVNHVLIHYHILPPTIVDMDFHPKFMVKSYAIFVSVSPQRANCGFWTKGTSPLTVFSAFPKIPVVREPWLRSMAPCYVTSRRNITYPGSIRKNDKLHFHQDML